MTATLQVVCMGEILIDFAAAPKGKGLDGADSFSPAPGGAPANVAVGLSRLGIESAFVGMVGDDAFGELLRNTLEAENVDTRSLGKSTDQPTTLAFVALDEGGVPDFVFYRHPGADQSIQPSDLDLTVFDSAKVFHFGSLSLVSSPAYDTTYACLEQASKSNITVSYDPNFRPALWPDTDKARERMLEPLKYVTILKVSEEEFELLSGESDLSKGCAQLASQGPTTIVITRGKNGMTLWRDGETIDVQAEPVNAVDTTGCGDSSVAGFLTTLLETTDGNIEEATPETLKSALQFANRCAAITAQSPGAIPALPRRSDLV